VNDASDLRALHAAVPETYEAAAGAWDAGRTRAFFERAWIDHAVAACAPGAPVLDLGCGAGEPIAAHMIARGFRVTGLDVAPAMLSLARARLPQADWRAGDMRALDLAERFAAIIGWDSFFHLAPDEQRALILRLVRHLRPGGRLLLTVGPRAGEAVGRVDGRPVYHASLDAQAHRALCHAAGCARAELVAEDPDCDFHSVLWAERAAAPGDP